MQEKQTLRESYCQRLNTLSPERRNQAKEDLFSALEERLFFYPSVMSFMSFSFEIDMSLVNRFLEKNQKLYLPKLNGDFLDIYQVTSLEKQVRKFSHQFQEPDPTLCQKTTSVSCVLVPAIIWGKLGERIGFGKGCYDRFLQKNSSFHTVGIGFKEQLSLDPIPQENHDQRVQTLCLV